MKDWEDGFLGGLVLGFATAEVIVRDGGGIAELKNERRKVEDYQAKERGVGTGRQAVESDIFERSVVAHPADIGLPWTAADDKLANASRVRPTTPPERFQ